MNSKIVYDIFHLVYWDWRIAVDLFLGGMGVGVFLFAIWTMFYKKSDQFASVKIGSVSGTILMTAGLLFMLSEMSKPIRIYKTLFRFNLTSTLSWGGLLQELFIVFSAVFAYLLLTNKKESLRKGLAIFAGFFAVVVGCYHSFLLSFATARPLWNAGPASLVSIMSFITTGIAGFVLLTSFSKTARLELREMKTEIKNILLISLLLQIFIFIIWIVSLALGKADFVNALYVLDKNFGLLLWFGAFLIGLILPLVTLLFYSVGIRKEQYIPNILFALPILIGGFIFRYVLVLAGQLS